MISVGDFWYTDCGKMVMEGENYGNENQITNRVDFYSYQQTTTYHHNGLDLYITQKNLDNTNWCPVIGMPKFTVTYNTTNQFRVGTPNATFTSITNSVMSGFSCLDGTGVKLGNQSQNNIDKNRL